MTTIGIVISLAFVFCAIAGFGIGYVIRDTAYRSDQEKISKENEDPIPDQEVYDCVTKRKGKIVCAMAEGHYRIRIDGDDYDSFRNKGSIKILSL